MILREDNTRNENWKRRQKQSQDMSGGQELRTRKWQESSLGQAMAKFVTRTDRKEW